mgnify:CR=1 FL=1
MDRLIYTAMSGAKQAMDRQATVSHNLANATTTGFRAQIDQYRAVPVVGPSLPTRAFAVDSTTGSDFRSGSLLQTGRALDVAVQGDGWFVVQAPDGTEAMTRAGHFQVDENGQLRTEAGLPVLGDGGPLSVPPGRDVTIGRDGTISLIPEGSAATGAATAGRLKLVNPASASLVRGDDGLFRLKNGATAEADPLVRVAGGVLESSNVNAVGEMIDMISLARQFDMQMKLLQNAQENDAKASQLLSMS